MSTFQVFVLIACQTIEFMKTPNILFENIALCLSACLYGILHFSGFINLILECGKSKLHEGNKWK
jgi:hypothetical protein